MTDEIPDTARELYARPPEEFVEARNALAKRLRDDGDAETARIVSKLRRPTVAAAVVNGASHAHPELVAEVLDAGVALSSAQRALLSKRSGASDELRTASERRRRAIRELTDAALADAEASGRPAGHLRDEVAGTFEAATLDGVLADRVRAGTVEKTVVPSAGPAGLEGFAVIPGGAGAEPDVGEEGDAAGAEGSRADRAADEAAESAKLVRAEADEAAAAAERAAAEAERLAAIAEEAERAARDARAEERRLRDEASTARRRAERAERAARAAAGRAGRPNR